MAEALSGQLTEESAQSNLRRQLVGTHIDEIRNLERSATDIGARRNVPRDIVLDAMARGVSASGGDLGRLRSAVDYASGYYADRPGDIGAFSGGLLDVGRGSGYSSAQVNAGLIAFAGGKSAVESQADVARTLTTHEAPSWQSVTPAVSSNLRAVATCSAQPGTASRCRRSVPAARR